MSEISLAPEITVRALRELRQSSSPPLLVDVREPWEVAAAGIQAAVCIPMGDIPSRAHAELDPDHPIVVVCHHGARSLSVTMWLRREGFEHVQSLAGGIDEWSRVIDPQVPRY